MHFTLKQHPMTFVDLQDFVQCYNPDNRHERHETWVRKTQRAAGAASR